MGAFLIGVVIAVAVAIAGAVALDQFQRPADVAYKTESVRLPAHNPG
ncbi:MAG TPA: hypothetical protein VHG27_04375 [Xanthobacteraceae bacterium]|nr:hypothetical protein [Xanthobacteraceae bacterium]